MGWGFVTICTLIVDATSCETKRFLQYCRYQQVTTTNCKMFKQGWKQSTSAMGGLMPEIHTKSIEILSHLLFWLLCRTQSFSSSSKITEPWSGHIFLFGITSYFLWLTHRTKLFLLSLLISNCSFQNWPKSPSKFNSIQFNSIQWHKNNYN